MRSGDKGDAIPLIPATLSNQRRKVANTSDFPTFLYAALFVFRTKIDLPPYRILFPCLFNLCQKLAHFIRTPFLLGPFIDRFLGFTERRQVFDVVDLHPCFFHLFSLTILIGTDQLPEHGGRFLSSLQNGILKAAEEAAPMFRKLDGA